MIINMAKTKTTKTEEKEAVVVTPVPTRGRTFEGVVVKKFPQRVVIERERVVYVPKYERFYKKKMRMHARLPSEINVEVGDLIKIRECRPLSKIIHAMVIAKVKSAQEMKK